MIYKGIDYKPGMKVVVMSFEKAEKKFGDIYDIPYGYAQSMKQYFGKKHVIKTVVERRSSNKILIKFEDNDWSWHPDLFVQENTILSLLDEGRLR